MIPLSAFKDSSSEVIDWIDQYFKNLESYPVKSGVPPQEIYRQIPAQAPKDGEPLEVILKDLTSIILPGITHWQHPNFHAYFPANSSVESILGEFISAALGVQGMVWETSPAATELEERMMEWLRDNMGLPGHFVGTIQDTASSASLVALLTAREKATNFKSNEEGVPNNLRVYASKEIHSSIEKAVGISGIGKKNLVKIEVDEQMRLTPGQLELQIKADLENGYVPCCVVAAIGTTGTVAVDPLKEIAAICKQYGIWLHVDAAYAGSALFLPEYRWMIEGIEKADSFVFNPHKWLFTNFDCSAYFVKDPEVLIQTFDILPEYLKTNTRGLVRDFRDWGIPLGRRFRALKLWFVLRSFGINGIKKQLRKHIELNNFFAKEIQKIPDFELCLKPFLNFTCFRLHPKEEPKSLNINLLNKELQNVLNQSGQVFLTHTKISDNYVLRMVIGQTYVEKRHIVKSLEAIKMAAAKILESTSSIIKS